MPCRAPIEAFRPANGGPLRFTQPTDGRAYNRIKIPCGYCILCREEQARQWAVRIYHESQYHADNCFLTATYADDKLPPHNSLDYAHPRQFLKTINERRTRAGTPRLRYYLVGEYGDKTMRPHYHMCIFGEAFLEGRILIKTTPPFLWTHPDLIQLWPHGHIAVGDLNFATARYTAQYLAKKLRSNQKYVRVDQETGELIALEQPKAIMSDNIGKAWWKEWHRQTVDHDYVIIDGRKQKPPKAYDRWLSEASPTTIEKIKKERKIKAKATAKSQEQTHARAQNAHARAKNQSKRL